MGFLSAYSGVNRIDLTSPQDPDGHYWVEVKKVLSGADLDAAEGRRTQTVFGGDLTRAAQAKADADKARAARARLGLPTAEDVADRLTSGVEMSVKVDQAAYRLELLTLAITDWNLTDERDQPLALAPLDARRRSLQRLPSHVYNLLFDTVEEQVKAEGAPREPEAEAQFRAGAETGGVLGS